ncbi:MAG: response regulator, partial [Nanoarchaeota archaeon]|nr:response regulator [Nanoarchaeota archaeon]
MTIKSDKNIKVLLVEDQYHIQNSLEKLILKENFQCKSIATGDESIKIFEEYHPDIIFMDIQLPKMNGFQATEKILSKNPHSRIILMSAFDVNQKELKKAFETGAIMFLQKPLKLEYIPHIIRGQAKISKILDEQTNQLKKKEKEIKKQRNELQDYMD